MNLTGREVYQKQHKSARKPNADERAHMNRVAALPCSVSNSECEGKTTVHHCGCGAGGRKNHKKVIPLCVEHHLGNRGINSLCGAISRREWEKKYGTEDEHLRRTQCRLKSN